MHLSEIAAFRFAVADGFFSVVLVAMRPRIWLELARLGSTRQSLPLRCCVVVGPTDTAKIPWQASHCRRPSSSTFWTAHRNGKFGFNFGKAVSRSNARIWRG